MTAPNAVSVRELGPKYANAVNVSGHSLVCDEPVADGGANAGPQPFEFVLAGLGACTTMTLRMYADRKGWKLRHVSVVVTMPEPAKLVRTVTLEGDLDEEQRRRLIAIAEHCPVHKFLKAEKTIETVAA
ncbi:MAG: OsmC family protein [Tagaea sp.]